MARSQSTSSEPKTYNFIYELPYIPRRDLENALNAGDSWRDLGGAYLGYGYIELEKFARSCYLPGDSPANALLTHWGQKNNTVIELFLHLRDMEHFHAMEALRNVVPEKFHADIKPPSQWKMTAAASGKRVGSARASAPPPPPPIPPKANYQHVQTHIRGNLDVANVDHKKTSYYNKFGGNANSYQPPAYRDQHLRNQPDPVSVNVNENPTARAGSNAFAGAARAAGTVEETNVKQLNVSQWGVPTDAKAAPSPAININLPAPGGQGQDPGVHPADQDQEQRQRHFSRSPSNQVQSGAAGSAPSNSLSRIRHRTDSGIPIPDANILLRNVPFEELALACNHFHKDNLIGKGGFGEVYFGIWQDQEVAVKRIKEDKRTENDKDYQRYVNQAITELQALHIYPAKNVLPIMAISFLECFSTDPCLVYQYMPNGSVSDRLKMRKGTPPLTWDQRSNIALGTARGLSYLHENTIIHGDIKSGNILLDQHFEPVIGDFGLARGGPALADTKTYMTVSIIQGTRIYLPDDYVRNNQLTAEVDTFSYGIFLFELVTGKSPSFIDPKERRNIRDIFTDKGFEQPEPYVDPIIGFSPWAKWLFKVGQGCAKALRKQRPKMHRVYASLKKLRSTPLPLALQKFYDEQKLRLNGGNANKDGTTSNNQIGASIPDGIPDVPAVLESGTACNALANHGHAQEESSNTPVQSSQQQENSDLMQHVTPEQSQEISDASGGGIPAILMGDNSNSNVNLSNKTVELAEDSSSTSGDLTSTNVTASQGVTTADPANNQTFDERMQEFLENMEDSLPNLSEHFRSLAVSLRK